MSAVAVGRAAALGLTRSAKIDASLRPLQATHASLKAAVDKALPGRALYAFGSITAYGFMEAGCDVDFVVLEQRMLADGQGGDDASQQARAIQAHSLGMVAKTLRSTHRTLKIDEVKRARVPVLRCPASSPPAFPTPFDLTVNRRNGVRNSWLLRSYFNQHPEARWLALAVKRWSKATALNGSCGGFLTSYAFNILVVHYYMTIGKMKFVPLSTTDVSKVPLTPTGLPIVAPKPEQLGADLLGFCDYYLSEFKYETDVVTLSREGRTTAQSLGWTREQEDSLRMQNSDGDGGGTKVYYRFCIEDPFEVNLNVGRNVTPFKLDILKHQLEQAKITGMGWLEGSPAAPMSLR